MLATSILSFTHQTESTQWFEGVSFTLNCFVAQNLWKYEGKHQHSNRPVIAPLKQATEIKNWYSDYNPTSIVIYDVLSPTSSSCLRSSPWHQVKDCQWVTPFLNKTIRTPATYMWTLIWYYYSNWAVFRMAIHPTHSEVISWDTVETMRGADLQKPVTVSVACTSCSESLKMHSF